MYDLKNQTFVVLGFSTIDELDDCKRGHVRLQKPAVVEIAAVKIEKGKIKGHYHSFIAIDGYNAFNIDFGDSNFWAYNLNAEHLIGAPSFKDVAERLRSFCGESTLIVNPITSIMYNPFTVFKDYAESFGYFFNNPTLNLNNVLTAARLQSAVKESGIRFENASTLQIAQMLACDRLTWPEIFADYDIYFNPDSDDYFDKGRNDPLSWALAFARLFIALANCDNEIVLEPIDEEAPF